MRSLSTRLAVVAFIAALALPGIPADACTSFLLKHQAGPLMAKNFDWDIGDGLMFINPRGLAKTAMVAEGAKPVRWTSRYGSATFNQYGREFPMGGMNEAGLAMEVLWLHSTKYPAAGDRRSINTLQWVQYCLDSFKTVSEVVASASELAIGGSATLHFMACDQSANCAVIEFLDGKLVSRSERTLPLPVLTNDTFADSLEFLNRTLGYGGEPVKPEGIGSLARFARATNGTHEARTEPGETPVTDAFAILADVAQPDSTQWSIVYDLRGQKIHFKTRGNPEIRTVELGSYDLDCTADPLMTDLNGKGSGPVELSPYSVEANRKTIEAGFAAEALTPPAPELIGAIAAYPDGLLCTFEATQE